MAEKTETITLFPEHRRLTLPKGDWVIFVNAEIRKIEVTDDVTC